MKSRAVKTILSIIIFLLIIAVIGLITRPVYEAVTEKLSEYEHDYIGLLEENIGITVRYKSLSPAILSGININGVEVYDVSSGAHLLDARRVCVKYSLKKIIRKKYDQAFTRLIINDAVVCYTDKEEYAGFTKKLLALTGYYTKEKKEKTVLISTDAMEKIKSYLFLVPFDVQINNLKGTLKRKTREYDLDIRSLSLTKRDDNSLMYLKGKGSFLMTFGFLKGRYVGFNYSLDGKIIPGLDGTSVIADVSNYKDCDFTVTSTELLFRYSDMEIKGISNTLKSNYRISGSLGLEDGLFEVGIDADHLLPPSLVIIRNFNDTVNKAYASVFTGTASFSKCFIKKGYDWNAAGTLDVSRSLISTGERLDFSVNGNKEEINVSSAVASGELLGAEFYGSYDITRKEPTAALLVDHFTLPKNGNKASFDLYVDPYKNGIMGIIPELYLNDQVYTGLELELEKNGKDYAFSFDMNDFSHDDYEKPGSVVMDGSVTLGSSPYIEASLNADSMFVDSILKTVSFVVDTKEHQSVARMVPAFESFITSDEIYFSTDLKSFAFNFPYGIVANTKKDRQILVVSLDGTDQSVSISQLSLLYGVITASATLDADYSLKDRQALFNTQCIINSIPYSFSGSFTDFTYLAVSGDYGTEINVEFDRNVTGSMVMESFPIKIKDYMFSFSADAGFLYRPKAKNYNVDINRFTAEEISGNMALQPKLDFTGNITRDGFVLSSIAYSDSTSSLEGNGCLLWQYSSGTVDSLSLSLNAASSLSRETFSLQADMTNPDRKRMGVKNLLNDWYCSLQVDMHEFPIGRFLKNQEDDDTINGSVYAIGTINNPYISINIDSVSAQVASLPLIGKGRAELVDGTATLQDFYANWNNMVVLDNISAYVDVSSFTGYAQTDLEVNLLKKQLKAPVLITLDSLAEETQSREWTGITDIRIPEEFTVTMDSEQAEGSLMNESIPLHAMISKIPGAYMLSTDDTLGTCGFYLSDGTVNLTIDKSKPLHLDLNGMVSTRKLDLNINDVYMDASRFSYLINNSYVSVYKGLLSGEVMIDGILNDPSFTGSLTLSDYDLNFPDFVPDHLTGEDLVVSLESDGFRINETNVLVKKAKMKMNGYVYMDRWKIDRLDLYLKTLTAKGIPLNVKIPKISVKGNAAFDINASYYNRTVDVSGDVLINNTDIVALDNMGSSKSSSSSSSSSVSSKMDIRLDMNLIAQQKVRVELKPVLTGIIVPDTSIKFIMDTSNGMWSAKGDVALKGGEVTYLSRNFYIKEGRVVLDENQNRINPLINVRAETREKDADGKSITIILSAKNQYLSDFHPVLTSVPAKSETEIMELFGQVLTGDSDDISNFLVAGVDYAAQLTMLQNLNNALRDLLNFDIFSLRSTFIQEAIKQRLNMNENSSNNYSLSNLFDNTTVYIGKYFGSSVYADAQLRWVYDEKADNLWGTKGTLQFQPDMGIELEAPFANIRWNFSPDLTSLNNQNTWSSANSITLSWSFTF